MLEYSLNYCPESGVHYNLVTGLDNNRNMYEFSEKGNPKRFSPNALNYFIR